MLAKQRRCLPSSSADGAQRFRWEFGADAALAAVEAELESMRDSAAGEAFAGAAEDFEDLLHDLLN